MRDIWLDDDEPGCLECGALIFKASRVCGICVDCLSDAEVAFDTSRSFSFETELYSFDDGEDTPWVEIL